MGGELSEIIKPFKILFIILIVEFLAIFIFFTALFSSYDKNLFEIKLNNTIMNCYYSEDYSNGLLVNAGSSGYNSTENRINEIQLSNSIKLDVNEYEVYYKNGYRKADTNGWLREDELNYSLVKNSKLKLVIKRNNKVLYDDDYISDLSSIINEKGRYYIHIYSVRKEGLLTSIKTHISFNVIVGGGNHE
ncbi:MAG: hypothetical protein J6D03_02505 [Clostridia bacterium]|nr:hypothetical protein [Clostridia bacterium]MBO5530527.1 hypothetical protein [Bacilli bacterium]